MFCKRPCNSDAVEMPFLSSCHPVVSKRQSVQSLNLAMYAVYRRESPKRKLDLSHQDETIPRLLFSLSFSSPNTRLLISSTASLHHFRISVFLSIKVARNRTWIGKKNVAGSAYNPSRPLLAFSRKRSTLASSILDFTFCQPPHSAVILASCSNLVLSWPGSL